MEHQQTASSFHIAAASQLEKEGNYAGAAARMEAAYNAAVSEGQADREDLLWSAAKLEAKAAETALAKQDYNGSVKHILKARSLLNALIDKELPPALRAAVVAASLAVDQALVTLNLKKSGSASGGETPLPPSVSTVPWLLVAAVLLAVWRLR